MSDSGSLVITGRLVEDGHGHRLSPLQVSLRRPPVPRLFVGQVPEAVVKTVPYLYTLCAQAQRVAAQAALAAASGETPRPPDSPALWSEALHEHFWRLLLDWPQALGLAQAKTPYVAWRQARNGGDLSAATRQLLENHLLGCRLEDWLAGQAADPDSLAGQTIPILGLTEKNQAFDGPALTPEDWLPYWRGLAATPPAPVFPASVGEAWQQRLGEAVGAALALFTDQPYPVASLGEPGFGIGQTLTARGVLTHAAQVDAGKVVAYAVWAPTDCRFADAGPLQALVPDQAWASPQAARQAVERAVLALDPCLPFDVKLEF